MHPNEAVARMRAAAEPRFPVPLSIAQARVVLGWALAAEAIDGWMDWEDESIRTALVEFLAAHDPPITLTSTEGD